jgi:type VI secretion system protein ImpF
MKGFVPGLFERLMDLRCLPASAPLAAPQGHSLEQFKEQVAHDLEALLNTRAALPEALFVRYPLARASVINYGLRDFAAFCLSRDEDRAAVCASLKHAIETHEPRLRAPSARLASAVGSVNRLEFVIHARLAQDGSGERVDFSGVLQPSSLHYAINKLARTRPPGGKR